MMTNGFGAVLGSSISGWLIQHCFTTDQGKDWQGIWLSFAAYTLVIAIAFWIFFNFKDKPKDHAVLAAN